MRDDISTDIATTFDTDLKDAVSAFVGTRLIANDDDWLDNGNTGTTISYQGRGIFGNFSQHEIDGNTILTTDVRLICLQSELTDTPKIDDTINGMAVVAVFKDPANVSYTIQLRGM